MWKTFDDKDLRDWQNLTMVNLDAAQAAWEVLDDELQGISQAFLISLLTIGDETWQDYIVEFDCQTYKKTWFRKYSDCGAKKKDGDHNMYDW